MLSLFNGRTLRTALAVAAFSLSALPAAQAHDFWVNAAEPVGGIVKAEIGYGHDFPKAEPIPEDRVHLFDALQLVTPKGAMKLDQVGENYAFQGRADLQRGSYLVLGTYFPTFWSKGEGGWSQTNRLQRPDATYCEEVLMFAKTVLNVDGGRDDAFISKPAGQGLEIVPLVNPAKVRTGEKFPVQIFYKGKPAKTVKVEAVFAGFSDKEYKAFQGRTDLEGKIDIIPLKAGQWFAEVEYSEPHPDKTKADDLIYLSTLSFRIDD